MANKTDYPRPWYGQGCRMFVQAQRLPKTISYSRLKLKKQLKSFFFLISNAIQGYILDKVKDYSSVLFKPKVELSADEGHRISKTKG